MSLRKSRPLYLQVSDMLLREIATGRLIEGERLATERALAAQYGISLGTLRKALADLSAKGHLERRQGSGNYVRNTREPGGLYGFFRLERVEGGGLPTAIGLSVDRLDKPADSPAFGPSPQAFRIRRIRALGGEPAVAEEIWLDATWAETLELDDITGSLYQFYTARLGLRIARVEDRVGVGVMPEWGAPHIGGATGLPCGLVERISWDQHGAPAEYSRNWFDHDKARYVSRMI